VLKRHPAARKRLLGSAFVAIVMAAGVLVVGALAGHGTRAAADGSGSCPKEILWCTVSGGNPGNPGGVGDPVDPGDGGGDNGCSYHGSAVACYKPGLGYYNSSDSCYYRREDPQPPAGDERWNGKTPADGAFYFITCYDGPAPWGSGAVDPVERFVPNGAGGPTPLELAEQALAEILLSPPNIQMAPSTTGVGGLVGLPVWMWDKINPASPNTWGPLTNSKSFGGLTVNIRAEGVSIVWNMGDGHRVTCDNPGTVYAATDGAKASPDCGYRYTKPSYSKRNGKYAITATATWHVNWAGGGQNGVIVVTRVARATVRINEAQVVVK
jgi:hypothetical protein